MTSSDLMGAPEVAAELGKSVRTVHRMVQRGELKPVVKAPGETGAYLFRRSQVAKLKQAARPADGAR